MNTFKDIVQFGGIDESQLGPLPSSGSYALVIKVSRKIDLKPEKPWTLDPGNYIYVGRACRGLQARIVRHKKRTKNIHWHIDRLTTHRLVIIKNVLIFPDHPEQECAIVRKLISHPESSAPLARFGSSDCLEDCPAHLIMTKN